MNQQKPSNKKGNKKLWVRKLAFQKSLLSAIKLEYLLFRQSFPASPKKRVYARRVSERRASLFRMEIFVGTYMRLW
jgi:hypothetical protein